MLATRRELWEMVRDVAGMASSTGPATSLTISHSSLLAASTEFYLGRNWGSWRGFVAKISPD